jgi:ribonuclease HI/DNA-binding transcriptional ArsR family regulator
MEARAAWRGIGAEDLMVRGIQAEWKDTQSEERLHRQRRAHRYDPPATLATEYEKLLREELEEGIVEAVDRAEVRWVNPTFLVPKKDGRYRKILDCRQLNLEIRDVAFKMEGPDMVKDLIRPGDWGTTLDIQSAFSHVPVGPSLLPYLAFNFRGQTYTYKGMPFGIKHAPRIFTQLMRAAAGAIRERWGARMITYMDDLLLLFQEQETARQQTLEIAAFLRELGWTLSEGKCQTTPSQRISFLGWTWNLREGAVQMTAGRRTKMGKEMREWIATASARKQVTVRELAKLIGNLNFLRLQIPEASLHLKVLDDAKVKTVRKQGWEGRVTATPAWLGDLKWWARIISQNTERNITETPPGVTLTTDAAPRGWGAILTLEQDTLYTYGFWNPTETRWTSNHKELSAVQRGLTYFTRQLRPQRGGSILIRSDNSTVVADINRIAATHSLITPLRQLLKTATRMHLKLQAVHLPGVENTEADHLSRMGTSREYYLKPEIFTLIRERFEMTPTLDPFAASPGLPTTTAPEHPRDAFRIDWKEHVLYLHPPPHMMAKTLSKLSRSQTTAILIAPLWKNQPWFPVLQQMTKEAMTLGSFEEVMTVTPRLEREGWKLPPGSVLAASVDTRTTREPTYSPDF